MRVPRLSINLADPRTYLLSGAVCAALLVISAFLPWSTASAGQAGSFDRAGIETDGVVTLAVAIAGAGVLAWRYLRAGQELRKGMLLLAGGLIVVFIAIIDIQDAERIGAELDRLGQPIDYSASYGLYLTLVGGAGLASLGALGASFALRPPQQPGRGSKGQ
jgi:hypothetical protein